MGGEGGVLGVSPPPPTRKSYVAWGRAKRVEATGGLAVHTQGSAYTWWCTHKAVQTQGSLWPLQESCYFRGVPGLSPTTSEASRLSSEAS